MLKFLIPNEICSLKIGFPRTLLFGQRFLRILKILEIGSFEGRSTVWLCQRFPKSKVHCVDTWEGSIENSDKQKAGLYDRFIENTQEYRDQIVVHRGSSLDQLKKMNQMFDIIYVDGSYQAGDVLCDAVQSHLLLKSGGIIIFDDFGCPEPKNILHYPRLGIESFYRCLADKYNVIHAGYQLIMKKC